jgi:glycosyltransferase involved in cell wall biosynthesis
MQKISAVLIMKNEEALLARCLESIKGVDEIILCDTGSTDKTVEIGKKYTDKIVYFQWCDNFAKARNYAKSYATGDWILSIDCDEFLHDFSKVREAIEEATERSILAINVKMIAEDNGQFFYFPRVFKNSPQVWWEGAIHNHISVSPHNVGEIEITHGYSPAHLQDKDRAFRILQKEVKETGNGREMFYLGREYYYRHDFESCVKILGLYVQKKTWLPEKAEAFLLMARAYWSMGMGEDARQALAQALIINANFKEAILFMATISGDGTGNPKWEANARQWKKMAETADNRDVLFIRN